MISVFDHPWLGALFGDEAAMHLWSPTLQAQHYVAFEAVLALALEDVERVPAGHGRAAAEELAAFRPDFDALAAGTAKDGVPIPRLVKDLRTASSYPEAIHTGATSQDVLDTALALTLREMNALFLARLALLREALDTVDARFGKNTLMGRTRMQAALPITVSDRIATWRAPLPDHEDRVTALGAKVEVLQLGGPVGTRAAWGEDADRIAAVMARELNLRPAPHIWHADRSGIVDFGNTLSLISGSLGKIGQDICLMAQQGIDEISLASGGASSAMPHKSNPIEAELLVTLARFNAGQVATLHNALVHEQERSGAAWMLEWMTLPAMTVATAAGLTTAITIIENIQSMGTEPA